jgi:Uncharacterised nucleotidyltransferase
MHASSVIDEGEAGQIAPSAGDLWGTIDSLLDRATPEGMLLHGLGALGAKRLRTLGRPVPPALKREERAAALFAGLVSPLLQRIRESCDGPLILIKGPEIARLYRSGGRAFSDIDLLSPEPEAVQKSLLAAGFIADQTGVVSAYHKQPLVLPALPLQVEVHEHVKWPGRLRRPPLSEIVRASGPSSLGIDGVLTPNPAHHVLIVAAHSWEHRPLRVVRDIIDAALLSASIDDREIEHTAEAWDLGPIWKTTRGTIDSLLYGGKKTVPLRSWARHLDEVRDRTVMESHLEHWMSPFWGLPIGAALSNTLQVLLEEVSPVPGESWRNKLGRTALAIRNPRATLGRHADALASEQAARQSTRSSGSSETER